MEKEARGQKISSGGATEGADFVLKWGNRKRLRCMKVKKELNSFNHKSSPQCLGKKKITYRVHRSVSVETEFYHPRPNCLNKNLDWPMNHPRRPSPEKEDRYYTTRGSLGFDENGKVLIDCHQVKEDKFVLPRLSTTLSTKEKEEDFMAMKGCKLPQRPKKRAKLIQRSLLLVSPGAWLSDLCQERYEVREKKTSKRKLRGLKSMMESDSE